MSRAFVRESDEVPGALPDRPVSTHPNFVTPRGLAGIDARVQELTSERHAARARGDTSALEQTERDLRYWTARRASARLIEPGAPTDRVRFGMSVGLRLASGACRTFRLVGEDEADATRGLLSWVAPLAQSLLGRAVGETVSYQGGEAEILSIEP